MPDYRNTNIVGLPLSEDVLNQIQVRSQALSQVQSAASRDVISYKGNKTCWIKLQSFSEILNLDILKDMGIAPGSIQDGRQLSKDWSLFSGIRNGSNLRFGISSEPYDSGTNYGTAGSTELGPKPMPGIVSATIETAGQAGSLRYATIKIKAYNLNQLSIIDALYFRLGFCCVLEWGHTSYLDSVTGALRTDMTPLTTVLNDNVTKEEVLRSINKYRKQYSNNYDAMLGVVSHYKFESNPDGSYDCTVRLTGIGSIIESLKVNTLATMPLLESVVLSTTVKNTDSTLNIFLSELKSYLTKTPSLNKEQFKNKLKVLFSSGLNLLDLNNTSEEFSNFKKGYNTKYMIEGSDEVVPDINFDKLCSYVVEDVSVVETGKTVQNRTVYIPLGLLLAYINNTCLMYNQGKETVPYVRIDFHPDTNYCYRMPQQLSVDPTICLVDCIANDLEYQELFNVQGVPTSKIGKLAETKNSKLTAKIAKQGVTYATDSPANLGKIMNILVNIDHIQMILNEKSKVDNKGNVYLSDFLTTLMESIQKALGNINDFRVGYNDDANVIFIYDYTASTSESSLPEIPIFGLTSVVKSYNLETEVSSKLSSVIAISARGGSTKEDNSAFLAINKNFKDALVRSTSEYVREFPIYVAPRNFEVKIPQTPLFPVFDFNNTETSTEDTALVTTARIFNEQVGAIFGSLPTVLNYSQTPSAESYYMTAINTLKSTQSLSDYTSITATGILPLAFNMTLEGLSGIRLFEGFTIPENRLPTAYKEGGKQLVGFVVAGITHTIENNQWNTQVRSLMVNIPKKQQVQKLKYKPVIYKNNGMADTVNLPPGCTYSPCARKSAQLYKKTALYNNPQFRQEIDRLNNKYGIVDPDALYVVMYAESKLNPQATLYRNPDRNGVPLYSNTPRPGWSIQAAGLIQFTRVTVPDIVPSLDILPSLDGVAQIPYIEKYFDRYRSQLAGADTFKVYSLVFFPAIARNIDNPDWVVESSTLSATTISRQNPSIACAAGKSPGEPLTVADFREYVNCIA